MPRQTLLFLLVIFTIPCLSQSMDSLYFEGGKTVNREKFYTNAIQRSVVGNLALPLNDDTEYDWQTAFDVLNVLNYSTPWINSRISEAVMNLNNRSDNFKESLFNLLNNIYPGKFTPQLRHVFQQSSSPKIKAMAAHYVLQAGKRSDTLMIREFITRNEKLFENNPVYAPLIYKVNNRTRYPGLHPLLDTSFLPGEIVVYSFQRQNRNYPGQVIVRKGDGSFVRNEDSSIFIIPQLARSNSNMPATVSNGNTPQGIFRMSGFGKSGSYFIGPTKNLQLTMPWEYKAGHYFKDSTLHDSAFLLHRYRKMLPPALQHYQPLYESWYAGKAGRSEIIAHGTTVNPAFYKGKPYYPFTPSNGCLVTEEWWNGQTGQLEKSGQYKLYKAVERAGVQTAIIW